MSARGSLLAIALSLAPIAARAQEAVDAAPTTAPPEAGPLSLDAVLRAVDRAFPLLQAARRDQDVADADLLSAEGAFDPALRLRGGGVGGGYYEYLRADAVVEQPTQLWGATLFAGYRIGRGVSYGGIPNYYGHYETNDYGEVRAGVQIPLWRNGPIDRRRASIRRAELGRPIAALNVEQATLEYRRAATQRYWDWVAAGRRLAVARALLGIATARNAGLAERVARGDLPAIERVDNVRAVAQREGLVAAAERGLQQAAIELSLYLRDERGNAVTPTPAQLPDGLPEPVPLAGVAMRSEVDSAQARRPELRRLAAQRAQLEIERDLARNQTMPAVDVVVAASQDLGPGSYTRERPEVDAALVVDIPILNRVARGRVRAAEAGIARIEEQSRFARDRVNADVRDALSAVEAALQRHAAARREVEVAREVEAAERARFDLGDSTLLAVNLREQAAAEASVREIDARADYHRAVAAYRAATATQEALTPAPPSPR